MARKKTGKNGCLSLLVKIFLVLIAISAVVSIFNPNDDDDEPRETKPPRIEETVAPSRETEPKQTTLPQTEPPVIETDIPVIETELVETETQPVETEPPVTETEAPETEAPVVETEAPETEAIVVETEPPTIETEATETEPPVYEPSTFSIHFIDVGQADAALVECDGHYMLIDGGNKGDSSVIYSILKSANVAKLDIVVATHAHEDHVGGLPGAFNYTSSDITLCPVTYYDSNAFDDFKKYAELKGGGITIPNVGDTYKLGSAVVEILGVNSTSDTNNSSIVLMITYCDTRFLFTGDAEREAEQVILNSGANLSATLLKVGHHGGDSSTTYQFLREIMPTYAVISVGEDNSYGHPTDNTLSRLRDADVKVFRTDMQGDIWVTSDGEHITITVARNSAADTLTNPVKVVETEAPQTSKPITTHSQDYILNTNSKKFHYPSCSSVKQMSEKNKASFTGTRDELINKGYDPCGRCNP